MEKYGCRRGPCGAGVRRGPWVGGTGVDEGPAARSSGKPVGAAARLAGQHLGKERGRRRGPWDGGAVGGEAPGGSGAVIGEAPGGGVVGVEEAGAAAVKWLPEGLEVAAWGGGGGTGAWGRNLSLPELNWARVLLHRTHKTVV